MTSRGSSGIRDRRRRGRAALLGGAALLVLCFVPQGSDAETLGTFTLDGLSFISFGDQQIVYLPAGSTVRFRFQATQTDGSTPFRVDPGDVSIGDVAIPSGGTLRYGLATSATGTMRATAEGREIRFSAIVEANLTGVPSSGTYSYTIPFTTELTGAANLPGTEMVTVQGMRLVDGVWYGQIVGATTNEANAFPEPGAAVYSVLSGSFDQVP